jgi:hypothetical protein
VHRRVGRTQHRGSARPRPVGETGGRSHGTLGADRQGVGLDPMVKTRGSVILPIMNIILILIVLLLLFGGGGLYLGGPLFGGGALGLILVIALLVYLTGGLRRGS